MHKIEIPSKCTQGTSSLLHVTNNLQESLADSTRNGESLDSHKCLRSNLHICYSSTYCNCCYIVAVVLTLQAKKYSARSCRLYANYLSENKFSNLQRNYDFIQKINLKNICYWSNLTLTICGLLLMRKKSKCVSHHRTHHN